MDIKQMIKLKYQTEELSNLKSKRDSLYEEIVTPALLQAFENLFQEFSTYLTKKGFMIINLNEKVSAKLKGITFIAESGEVSELKEFNGEPQFVIKANDEEYGVVLLRVEEENNENNQYSYKAFNQELDEINKEKQVIKGHIESHRNHKILFVETNTGSVFDNARDIIEYVMDL